MLFNGTFNIISVISVGVSFIGGRNRPVTSHWTIWGLRLGLWCLTLRSTILQLYRCDQLYHIMLYLVHLYIKQPMAVEVWSFWYRQCIFIWIGNMRFVFQWTNQEMSYLYRKGVNLWKLYTILYFNLIFDIVFSLSRYIISVSQMPTEILYLS